MQSAVITMLFYLLTAQRLV